MTQATTKEKTKYQVIYDCLIAGIKNGKFPPESKLPSERALADKFNVNLATIRRAFKDLVSAGLVEKRVGDGTYLKSRQAKVENARYPLVNILISNYDGPVHKEFVECVYSQTEKMKITPHIIRVPVNNYLPVVQTIDPETPLLVLAEDDFINDPMRQMLKKSFHNVVLVSGRLDMEGVHSVIGDDHYGIRLLVEYLRELNHKKIALVCNSLHHPVEKMQTAIWQSIMEEDNLEFHLINSGVPQCGQPMDYAYKAVTDTLQDTSISAIICLNDELAIGTMAACRDFGLRIPDDISIASIGNTALCRYAYPSLTCIDPDISEHVRQGLEMLMDLDTKNTSNLRVIKPLLVVRNSVAKCL